jgi:hypothetical protein
MRGPGTPAAPAATKPAPVGAGRRGRVRGPGAGTGLALRANPFPEVTDPFCRLPLPTLFYGLEAAHLGDLMRLSVRPGVCDSVLNHSGWGFSRALRRAPDARGGRALCRPTLTLSPAEPFPG